MPIKFWWWIPSMAATGFITALIFLIAATVVDKMRPNYRASAILALIGAIPWMITAASTIIWLVINALVLIWGR